MYDFLVTDQEAYCVDGDCSDMQLTEAGCAGLLDVTCADESETCNDVEVGCLELWSGCVEAVERDSAVAASFGLVVALIAALAL
jgi:hypothetical protein